MGAILYPLFAISGLLSAVSCRPAKTAAQQLQSQQPYLNGLPSNSGMTLKYVALGVGTQNYTCNGASWVQTDSGDGANATLYDATSYLAQHTSEISILPAKRLLEFVLSGECQQAADNNPYLDVLGKHYFDSENRPTFNLYDANPPLFLSAAKVDSATAPYPSVNVAWLYLVDNGDGLSNGLKAVYRVETAGGAAPTSCSSSEENQQTFIPYAAEYWFYD